MGTKQSSVVSERYQESYRPTISSTPTEREPSLPLVAPPRAPLPPLPERSSQSRDQRHPLPPEPPLFFSSAFPPPPHSSSSRPQNNTMPQRQVPSHNPYANRPLPRLPNVPDNTPSDRHQRFLDLEALLVGLEGISPPEPQRNRSSSSSSHHNRPHHHHHHHHHRHRHTRHRERNNSYGIRRERDTDMLDDPLSFLRSLTSKLSLCNAYYSYKCKWYYCLIVHASVYGMGGYGYAT